MPESAKEYKYIVYRIENCGDYWKNWYYMAANDLVRISIILHELGPSARVVEAEDCY